FFFSSRRRHTRSKRDWSSDVCSSDLHHYPNRADLLLLPRLPSTATKRSYLLAVDYFAHHGRVHSVFHYLLTGDDGVLGTRNFNDCFHCLLIRILSRRPDVSGRYYANWRASSHEMAAVLLRAILPDRDFSRPPARRRAGSGTGYP